MSKTIEDGQSFDSADGRIRVVVLTKGSRDVKARFEIIRLNTSSLGGPVTYTIYIQRKSSPDYDRIVHKTDDVPERTHDDKFIFELSSDETIGIEIKRN